MSIKARLSKLEKAAQPRNPGRYPYSDAQHNRSMDLLAKAVRAGIVAKWQAVINGDPLPAPLQDTDPATQALRDEIARRLDRIAEAQNDTVY